MRGAPQVGFSATIWKINWRICLEILLPPPTRFRTLQSMAQYNRNPARCQRTTVSGMTRRSESFQLDQNRRATTQNSLSSRPSLGLGCRRFSTVSCCPYCKLHPTVLGRRRGFLFPFGHILPRSNLSFSDDTAQRARMKQNPGSGWEGVSGRVRAIFTPRGARSDSANHRPVEMPRLGQDLVVEQDDGLEHPFREPDGFGFARSTGNKT